MRRARWTSQQVVERGQRAAACVWRKRRKESGSGSERSSNGTGARGRETPLAEQNEKGAHAGDAGGAPGSTRGSRGPRRRARDPGTEGRGGEDGRQGGRKGRAVSTLGTSSFCASPPLARERRNDVARTFLSFSLSSPLTGCLSSSSSASPSPLCLSSCVPRRDLNAPTISRSLRSPTLRSEGCRERARWRKTLRDSSDARKNRWPLNVRSPFGDNTWGSSHDESAAMNYMSGVERAHNFIRNNYITSLSVSRIPARAHSRVPVRCHCGFFISLVSLSLSVSFSVRPFLAVNAVTRMLARDRTRRRGVGA